jgi:hypothetical protein
MHINTRLSLGEVLSQIARGLGSIWPNPDYAVPEDSAISYRRYQLGARPLVNLFQLDFDPLDTPRNRFIVGGQAWQWCRAGKEDPQKFGIFDMHGMAFIAGDLMRDFLAFNKVEILPWDGGWGYITDQCYANIEDGSNFGPMDRLAALTLAGDAAFEEIRDLYEDDPNFHVPVDCF